MHGPRHSSCDTSEPCGRGTTCRPSAGLARRQRNGPCGPRCIAVEVGTRFNARANRSSGEWLPRPSTSPRNLRSSSLRTGPPAISANPRKGCRFTESMMLRTSASCRIYGASISSTVRFLATLCGNLLRPRQGRLACRMRGEPGVRLSQRHSASSWPPSGLENNGVDHAKNPIIGPSLSAAARRYGAWRNSLAM